MKSRTNAQQELMRQQIIEEERNLQNQKYQSMKALPMGVKFNKIVNPSKNFIYSRENMVKSCVVIVNNNSSISKRERSSSDISQLKVESFSPTTKSPMDLAFSNLGNDHDVLDWNQIEPSITTTSDISPQEILEQISRSQNESIPEGQMETGTEENDSIQDDQSVSSLKPSTSCPANMANPFHATSGPTVMIKYHQLSQKSNLNQTSNSTRSSANNTPQIVTSIPTGLPEEQKLQWVRDRNKKDCHNRIERKRRDYINNQIQELGQLLPEKLFLSTESKRNKGGILKNSVIYIQQLQESMGCISHLQKEAQISENLITEFYKNIQNLQELLKSNGINYEQNVNYKNLLQEWFNIHQNNSLLLQKINAIQSTWTTENNHRDKISVYTNYDDVSTTDNMVSAENILNSISIPREQTINSGGGSSSGTPITNYSSPITNTSSTLANSSRSRQTPVTNMNIISVNSPQQFQSHVYGSSQPYVKSNFRLYDQQQSKPGITDSPVLSSILIGSGINNNGVKTFQDIQSSSKINTVVTSHSNSVPDESRIGFFGHSSDNNPGERYYLIPITKAKNVQLVTGELRTSRGLVKVETDYSYNEDPVLSRIHSDSKNSPKIQILNSYTISSLNHEEEVQNCIEISPDQIDNDDSLMGEFEFDDIPME